VAVALVTGASRGIGAACAVALARDGHDVGIGYMRDEAGARRTAEAVEALGRRALVHQADVGDESEAAGIVEAAEAGLGPLDALVMNAGANFDALAVRMSAEDWNEALRVNLTSAFFLSRAVLRGMLRRRAGTIVAVSSIVALSGNAGQANYAAAKAGLIGLVRTLARETGPRGIRVNAVVPGYIETDMTARLEQRQQEAILGMTPLGRLGRPDDVAGVVAFMCSPAAAYITGALIPVDGGLSM